jgi:hypothetical protein
MLIAATIDIDIAAAIAKSNGIAYEFLKFINSVSS